MDNGAIFKNAIINEIKSWNEEIEVLSEIYVGMRFVNTPRRLDIVLKKNNKYMGIEAKIQLEQGTTYQKLSYTLEDCRSSPIPTIIVFAGNGIKEDMKSKLITSGLGIEVEYFNNEDTNKYFITDKYNMLRQRVAIHLGLDWFKLFK